MGGPWGNLWVAGVAGEEIRAGFGILCIPGGVRETEIASVLGAVGAGTNLTASLSRAPPGLSSF